MITNNAPLFNTFEDYLESLPVRRSITLEGYVKLVELPFFARNEDLMMMVSRLEGNEGSESARSLVRYGCGQSGSGKTSSICPAFLCSAQSQNPAKFSHYLYLAFANNNANSFMATGLDKVSTDEFTAATQGAAFMLECLRKLLAKEQGKCVEIKSKEEVEHETVESFASTCSAFLTDEIEGFSCMWTSTDEWRMTTKKRQKDIICIFEGGRCPC